MGGEGLEFGGRGRGLLTMVERASNRKAVGEGKKLAEGKSEDGEL